MGSHFKERLCAPDSRLLGMFVKFPTMETIEILASAGLDRGGGPPQGVVAGTLFAGRVAER